jgi:hypothetical protein
MLLKGEGSGVSMDLVPKYFFLDKKLYQKVRVVKSENYVVAWCFQDEKRVWLTYSYVRKNAEQAYTLSEVAELVDRPKAKLLAFMNRNLVDMPSGRLYNIRNKVPGRWLWSEQDVLNLRDSLFEMAPKNKYGEPYSNLKLISRAELLSKMRKDASLYVRNENGDFVKVWRAE